MKARLYRPSRSAMQSGGVKGAGWVFEFEPSAPRTRDPLMGWTSSADTRQQLRLNFESEETARAYCKRNGLDYVVCQPRGHEVRPKSYSDNFRWDPAQ
jgi:hypothetical protein